MKRKYAVIIILLLMLSVAFYLQKGLRDIPDNSVESNTQAETVDEGATTGETNGEKNADAHRMIMIDGRLYADTGLVNSAITCGTLRGTIKSSVDESMTLQEDEQSNFGTGYGYQIGVNGTINVNIDGKWIIFQDIAISSIKMDGVANFEAEIVSMDGDDIMVNIVDIPEMFAHVFGMRDISEIKPIILPRSTVFDDGSEMIGRIIRVWFDGTVINDAPEMSNPIKLGELYRVDFVEE